ncbi:hypothetical protein J4405_00580 [Candidatus Woesearchaeota archaeon]|nr:hypothetical protein [Candidatus Woesearchaeota archaeon]
MRAKTKFNLIAGTAVALTSLVTAMNVKSYTQTRDIIVQSSSAEAVRYAENMNRRIGITPSTHPNIGPDFLWRLGEESAYLIVKSPYEK